MNGIEMAREIRAINPDTAFVVLTAYGAEQFKKSFAEIGVCSFLNKPIDFQELFDSIESCIVD
jgi:YesN/AraC family two-component response regulator